MSNIDKHAHGEKTREAFERWAEQSGALPWGILKKHRNQDGTYPGPHYTYMWHAWNACHEALLDELEAKGRRIEEEIVRANREHHRGFMMACGHLKEHSNVHYADAAEMEIAALRKRINELEAREVKLPERYEVDMCPTPSPDGEWYSREDVLSALVSAGLKVAAAVKGEAS
nr:ead/Ea22-like family protein [Enterobacter cloacae complex sp. I1M]